MCQGLFRTAVPRSGSSESPSYTFEDKFLLHEKEDSKSKTSLANRGVGIENFCGSFLNTYLCSAILPVSIGFDLQEADMPYSLTFFRRVLAMVRLQQADLQKTCPDVAHEFCVSNCKQESRLTIPLGLGIPMVDLDRGIIHSCSQFQDDRILLHRSRNSPCLAIPESEP